MLPNYDVDMQLDVKVPMRDGINLSADIYLPRAHGTFPTVLMRTPYSNNADGMVEKARRLANNGYACVFRTAADAGTPRAPITRFVKVKTGTIPRSGSGTGSGAAAG